MAWVSPKVYAILSGSEEGKDIIQKLPDMSQDEASKEIDAFFGEGGKGASSSEDYGKAKLDDEAEENAYKTMGDEEVSEKDYEEDKSFDRLEQGKLDRFANDINNHNLKTKQEKIDFIEEHYLGETKDFLLDNIDYFDNEDEPKGNDVSDDEISEHLDDYSWSITDNTTAGQFAQECADRLGCSKERVFEVLKKQAPEEITEDSKMASLMEGGVSDLDNDVFDKNYKQALETNNYEKAKAIYDRQVQDKGVDSPEAKGTKKALDEMSKNFDQGENKEDKMLKLYRLYDKAQSEEEKNEYLKQLNKLIEGK